MKHLLTVIVAIAALSACSGNANQAKTENQNAETTTETSTVKKAQVLDKEALKQEWSNRFVLDFEMMKEDVAMPNQICEIDLDNDGYNEILLRHVNKEFKTADESEAFDFAAFATLNGEIEMIVDNYMWQTGGNLKIFKTGWVVFGSYHESGEGCETIAQIVDSKLVHKYYSTYEWNNEWTGEEDDNEMIEKYEQYDGNDTKEITKEEYNNFKPSYEDEFDFNELNWKDF